MWPFARSAPKLLTETSSKRDIARSMRSDAWKNIFTKLGSKSRDKRSGGRFDLEVVTSEQAAEMWIGDPLMAKVIEKLPKAAVRKGYRIKGPKKDQAEQICAAMEALHTNREIVKAGQFERAYGGAALFPFINDGRELHEELDEAAMTLPEHFTIFEPRELRPNSMTNDPRHKNHGKVETWRLNPVASFGLPASTDITLIHSSRLIIFPGIVVTKAQTIGSEFLGWGGSLPTRIFERLRDLNLSWAAAAAVVQDFAQAVYKLEGLAKLIEDDADDEIIDRLLQMDISRSILRAIVIDKNDDFSREVVSLSGLVDILVQFMSWFAAACDMPVTKLFGISPAGLNATGESDITMWDDTCEEWQDEHMPQMEQLVRMFMLAQDGPMRGKEPETWSVEFNEMRTPSPQEQAELRKTVAETDQILIDAEIISPEEAAQSHYGGDTYSPEITVDWKARERQLMAVDPVVKPEPEYPIDPLTGLPIVPPPGGEGEGVEEKQPPAAEPGDPEDDPEAS